MNSSFITRKFITSERGDETDDLLIELREEHYKVFAERLLKDLTSLELHDVFMNTALKDDQVCCAFIDELKRLSYQEIKELFFSKQEDTSKIVSRSKHVGDKLEIRQATDCELDRQNLLVGGVVAAENASKLDIRIISWVLWSPLYAASRSGHVTVVEALLNEGADVNQCNTDCKSPLSVAVKHGQTSVADLLVKHCAKK